ncbi:peptidase family C78-domain-containing protein [Lentinula raphanica]|nr:peptidase family C78-domain-containing protein [Lentinula raphanica]
MSLQCQLCWADIEQLSVAERQRHYDNHLAGDSLPRADSSTKTATSSTKSNSWFNKGKFKMMPISKEKEQDVFWYPAMQTPPPINFVPGFIPVLKKALLESHAKGKTTRAVLCYDRAVYVSRQIWDASWGCGYRNFLMSCASLMDQPYQPLYFPLIDQPLPPGVRNLQVWIEDAWNNGFDVEGREQLKKLVDTNKWIGTSDICAAFLSRGIPAELVDFEIKDLKKGLTPLTNWIVRYFDKYKPSNSNSTVNGALLGASPVQCAPCMPLIVQDNKHSRMVVGYEMTKSGVITLLVFDPSRLPSKQLRSMALSGFNSTSFPPNKRRENESSGYATNNTTHKRMKINHEQTRVGGATVIDVDDDCEIEFIGEVRKAGQGDTTKVNNDTPLSYSDVLKHFRWENRLIQKKQKYQILYFPLELPLTKSEMKRRKILTSEQIS